jgi:ATP/maltotriose-dependent transcriptional regulator MalT
LWWSGFTFGFTLLFHGDLDEATAVLREILDEAERQGDAGTRARALTYLMVAGRKRGDVDGVRKAIGPVIERAREASLPEYEAMALANRAWVAWRTGEQDKAAADAKAALEQWEKLPVRYFFDWMALWPLVAIALGSGRIEQAVEHARGMLHPPQQLLQEPVRTMADDAVHGWDSGDPAEAEELLCQAVRAASDLGYL